jgi:hypothetical protein
MRTQNLNLLIFAKTLVARSVNSFCVAGIQRAKGPLADFLSPFLCSVTKKWHPCRYTERAKLGEAVGESS